MLVQTLKGAEFQMKAQCQFGHERKDMLEDHMHKLFFCPECNKAVSPDRIYLEVPEAYRPQVDPVAHTFQKLMDFEIVAVIKEDGELYVEYPKREHNHG